MFYEDRRDIKYAIERIFNIMNSDLVNEIFEECYDKVSIKRKRQIDQIYEMGDKDTGDLMLVMAILESDQFGELNPQPTPTPELKAQIEEIQKEMAENEEDEDEDDFQQPVAPTLPVRAMPAAVSSPVSVPGITVHLAADMLADEVACNIDDVAEEFGLTVPLSDEDREWLEQATKPENWCIDGIEDDVYENMFKAEGVSRKNFESDLSKEHQQLYHKGKASDNDALSDIWWKTWDKYFPGDVLVSTIAKTCVECEEEIIFDCIPMEGQLRGYLELDDQGNVITIRVQSE